MIILIILKYFIIGLVITTILGIVLALISTLVNEIDGNFGNGCSVFIMISIFIGFLAYLYSSGSENDVYRYKITHNSVSYYTNDIIVSNGVLTFIDNNEHGNTIYNNYTIIDRSKEDK